jgi:hypothetical protein
MPDETAPQPQIKIAWLIGTLAAFALFAAIGGYSVRMTQIYVDYDQQKAQERYATLEKLRHDEQALLAPVDAQGRPTAEWVDQGKGVIRIPIEEAMAKEIDALKGKPVAMGTAIPVPVPAAPAQNGTNTVTTPAAPVAEPATATLPKSGATNAPPTAPVAPAAKNATPAAGPAAATTPPNK